MPFNLNHTFLYNKGQPTCYEGLEHNYFNFVDHTDSVITIQLHYCSQKAAVNIDKQMSVSVFQQNFIYETGSQPDLVHWL